MYNIVLIGCGHMGTVHLDDIYMMEKVCIYGVVDTDINRAKEFAKKYNAKSYDTSYERYFSDKNTDIIICATYPSSHLEILKKCVKYNKHLLCEKPIAASIDEVKEFADIVRKAQIKVQIGYILRFNETYKTVAKMIQNGALGSPLVIRMTQNHHVKDWKKYSALLSNASPIVDCGVHYADICRWFTKSEISDTNGIGLRIDSEVPSDSYNYGLMTFKMTDGSIAYYEAGWGNTISAKNVKEFIGPLGRIEIIEREHRTCCQEEGDLIKYYKYPDKIYETINVDCKRRPTGVQLAHLIKMIEKDIPAVPTIDEIYDCMLMIFKADEVIRRQCI